MQQKHLTFKDPNDNDNYIMALIINIFNIYIRVPQPDFANNTFLSGNIV